MKKNLLHGIIAGLLSGIAGIVYLEIYYALFFVDFSMVINWGSIIASSTIGTILMTIGYFGLDKLKKLNLVGWLNAIYVVLAFLSIIPVMLMSLPLEVEFPELFPGLTIPMHFFPVMIFFGLTPFFSKNSQTHG